MTEVRMPNGDIVSFPDEMPKEQIRGLIEQKFPETATQQPQQQATPQEQVSMPVAALRGLKSGVTAGFADEAQGGVAALYAKMAGAEAPMGDLYREARDSLRQEQALAKDQQPWSYGLSEAGGGILSGAAAATRLGGAGLAKALQTAPAKTTAALGATSGGLYGFGTGEGTLGEQATNAAVGAGIGLVAAPAGSFIGSQAQRGVQAAGQGVRSLADKAKRLFGGAAPQVRVQPQVNNDLGLQELIQASQNKVLTPADNYSTMSANNAAMAKVIEAIKRDFPDNSEQILQAWKTTDVPLAELYGKNITNLAKGAAQYPKAQPATERYFEGKIADSPDKIRQAISKNISSVDNYYATADDLLKAGRAKAAPLYDKAYAQKGITSSRINQFLEQPELKAGLKQGLDLERIDSVAGNKAFNAGDYAVTGFNQAGDPVIGKVPNMKMLDTAKRGLDAMIKAETDVAGNITPRGRSLLSLKDAYLKELDNVSPAYKEAREAAGDYFKIDNAIKSGKDFMKEDSELIGKNFKALSAPEKEAYKIGVGKQMRDLLENQKEGFNSFNRLLGSTEQKKRLMKVLSPTEYKNLETSLRAEDRLFKMRNEVLGGSPTTSKAMAAANIASGGADLLQAASSGGIANAPRSAVKSLILKAFDGLNDNKAEAITKILYETDPVQKLKLIEQISSNKQFTQAEKRMIKQSYFEAQKYLTPKVGGMTGAVVGAAPDNGSGITPEMIENSNRVTVTTPRGTQ